jgi:hypothetical protein
MIIGTVFTLFVVPSIYVLVARTHVADSKKEAEMAGLLPEAAETAA